MVNMPEFADRDKRAMALSFIWRKGAKVIDPTRVYAETGTSVGEGTLIYPDVYLYGKTKIGKNCTVFPGVHLFDAIIGDSTVICTGTTVSKSSVGKNSVVGANTHIDGTRIGPRVRIEPFSLVRNSRVCADCRIGPFADIRNSHVQRNVEVAHAEINRSKIGSGTFVKHFSYVGDAIVGENCNIGAGTVFCNYNGRTKHVTTLEDGVFVGSGTMLVAPLLLGRECFIAAGSVVTKNVPPQTLVIARGQEHEHDYNELAFSPNKKPIEVRKNKYVKRTKDGWEFART